MLASVLIAALLTSPSPVPGPERVEKVDITSTWSGLAPTERYHVVLLRKAKGLVGDANIDAVPALLAAIEKPPTDKLTPQMLFPYDDAVTIHSTLHDCVGDAADLPDVKNYFKALFTSDVNQRQWIARYFNGDIIRTDDYPAVRVSIMLNDGHRLLAQSESQSPLMLPFTITRDGVTFKTFDPALSHAVADVISGNTNADRLRGYDVSAEYAEWLCYDQQDSLTREVLAAYAPPVSRALERDAWMTSELKLSSDLSILSGRVRLPAWPTGFSFALSAEGAALNKASLEASSLSELAAAQRIGARILAPPWVQRWFHSADQPALLLERFTGGPYYVDSAEDLERLRRHAPQAYRDVAASLTDIVYGQLWDKSHRFSSDWLFLPDGHAILIGFSAEATRGPLDGVSVRSWSSNLRHEDDASYEFRSTAVVLDPQGRIVFSP